ncbi:MAG: ribosome maturation factor RimM [Pseudoflavonifractor sp.]|nr:ribosome maturation factor RimM [Pseudoflavonifractor sp.]
MIKSDQLTEIGKFNKPHGINGELSLTLHDNVDPDLLRCVIVDIDGINVPFFIESIRPKTSETYLVTIDGIDTEEDTRLLVNKTAYVSDDDTALIDEEPDGDGLYASSLIGYTVIDGNTGNTIGHITDIEDSTANALFIVEDDNDATFYIPIADEFITDINPDAPTITVNLPEGLLQL